MQDEKTILCKAREAIASGRLPNRRPDRLLGGTGFGALCAVCSEPVTPDQVEYEMEFTSINGSGNGIGAGHGNGAGNGQGNGGSPGQTHHVHIRCFAAWEFERHGWQAEAPDEPTMSLPTLDERGNICAHESPKAGRRGPAR